MKGRILVLGSSNADLILRIPRFHRPGETISGESLVTAFGGKGANQAMAARRLGAQVTLLTRLGKDSFGKSYRKHLARNGLPPRYLLQDPRLPTGVAVIELVPGGENRIIVSPGANGALSVKDLDKHREVWRGVKVFVAQLETPLGTVVKGLTLARAKGCLTILNPAPAVPLPAKVLPLVDFLVPNEGEAQALAGMKTESRKDLPKMARRLLARGAGNVVITLGPRGLYFQNRNEEFQMDAFRVKAVDATAAGDAFVGALACGLAEGKGIREALNQANAAGALATTKLGAQPSLPGKQEVRNFLRLI